MKTRSITFLLWFFLIIVLIPLFGKGTEVTMAEQVHGQMMRIYFIPFAIETYVPVTMSNIEEKSVYSIWFTKEHPFIPELHRLLQLQPGRTKIDNRIIRLKVEFAKESFYADQEGHTLEESAGRNFLLSKKQLDEIERKIVYFSGVVDIKAAKDIKITK